jgi:uncharacterized Ntn-hydrolase superfamily protein
MTLSINRTAITHWVSTGVKALSIVAGVGAYANWIPGKYGALAVLVFALASASKDLLTSVQSKLTSNEAALEIVSDTLKESSSVVDAGKKLAVQAKVVLK